jgi:hypothetical protein
MTCRSSCVAHRGAKKQAFDELRPLARASTSALDAISFVLPESADGAPIKGSCSQMIQDNYRAPDPSGNAAGFIIAWSDIRTHSRISGAI